MPTEKWALCYRHFQHGDTDTNIYLGRKLKGIQSLRQAQPQHKNQNLPDTNDMEDTNTDEFEIVHAESTFSPEKGWLQ